MNRKLLSKAVSDIDDRFIVEAYNHRSEGTYDVPERIAHMKPKRVITFFLAAVLVLALGITAYAEGWISPIFHRMQSIFVIPDGTEGVSPQYASDLENRLDLYSQAEQYMNENKPEPETVTLPEFDNSSLTLSERFYNGEVLMLGIDLNAAEPEMIAGYEPDEKLLEKIKYVAFFHDVNGDDDLDTLLENGMTREIYDDYLEKRTDYAKEFDFRHQSAIFLDWMLKNELSAEKYEEAWALLRKTGHICAVKSVIYIGDHITMDDGTDIGPTGQQNMDSSDPAAHSGNIFIEANELPDAAKNLGELNIRLSLKKMRIYYYMELGGPARFYSELIGEEVLPFTVQNSIK
ncbi:MAG: hypothetical protein K5771_00705 [Oscillospiraceae bacterium]|nr:hypothetical protein [Oscillospiraceae bacterium]